MLNISHRILNTEMGPIPTTFPVTPFFLKTGDPQICSANPTWYLTDFEAEYRLTGKQDVSNRPIRLSGRMETKVLGLRYEKDTGIRTKIIRIIAIHNSISTHRHA